MEWHDWHDRTELRCWFAICYDVRRTHAMAVKSAHADELCMVITYSKSMDQPGKVANLARGRLDRENEYSPVPVRV